MSKTLSTRFQEIYNQLDNHLRNKLNLEHNVPHTYLIKEISKTDRLIRNQKNELIQFAQLRNAIVHNPDRSVAHPIAEPHKIIVERYEDILEQILNPVKALDVAIPNANIYSTTLDKKAMDVMSIMNEKIFTHVPVLNDDKIFGVFSENVVFSYLVKNEIAIVEKDTRISEFKDFLPLDNHPSEFFKFVPKSALLIEIQELFEDELKSNLRLGAVFITNSGNQNEKLLGLITAWDIAGK